MNKRLLEIIRYKTGGKQTQFAELMGWSPQYLAKLLKGDSFGLQPVLAILSAFPEINARWFLFGQGAMLEVGMMFDLQRQAMSHVMSLLDLEKYIPVMSGDEIREFETAVSQGRYPNFSDDTVAQLRKRLGDHTKETNERFAKAQAQSDRLCKQ